MRAGRVAVGEVRAPDSDASGAFTAKIYWRLDAERLVAPKRRKVPGAFMPKTVWLLNGESSQLAPDVPLDREHTRRIVQLFADVLAHTHALATASARGVFRFVMNVRARQLRR
jgi:hypothetical protein